MAVELDFDPKEYLQQGNWADMKLGLHRVEELLARLGNPERSLAFVHVAGTNGKGSTCAFIASILQAAGYKTGLFTSPYILEFNERIQINRRNISDDDLAALAAEVRAQALQMEEHPTAFELVTVVALLYFARSACDIVVLEVGLGGRLDATNVVTPAVCAICPIDFDHMGVLGETLEEIAAEKAGIIKPGVPVVCYEQPEPAAAVVQAKAAQCAATLIVPRFDRIDVRASGLTQTFSYDGIHDVGLRLAGTYQPCNAVMAIEVARQLRSCGYDIPDEAIKAGLEATVWHGRFEVVREKPYVIVDGGHNEQGARVLAQSLKAYFPQGGVTFVMGVLGDKAYRSMVDELAGLGRAFFCVTPPDAMRALPAADLAQCLLEAGAAQACACESIPAAIDAAIESAGEDGVVCCCGSLYSIGQTMAALGAR